MNVVVWARVSSREQREGYSIDAQLRRTRDRVLANGWQVVREFVVAESAKRGAERHAFNEMFAWVKTNAKREKIKAILSHKLDRICRNMRDAVRLQELEDACGVQLAFVENQFGPGAAGGAVVQCDGGSSPILQRQSADRGAQGPGRESPPGLADRIGPPTATLTWTTATSLFSPIP